MKLFSSILLGLAVLSQADGIVVGGYVAPRRDISCEFGPRNLNLDVPGKNISLFTCTISDNLPEVDMSIKILLPGISLTSVELKEVSGKTGLGLELPLNQNLVPSMRDGVHQWHGTQKTATLDYTFEVIVSWDVITDKTTFNPDISIQLLPGSDF